MKSYRLNETVGDKYAAAWVTSAFDKNGVEYKHSQLTASQLYLELLPRLNGRTIKLLDNPRAIAQIAQLERRTSRSGGRDTVSHPANGHDDLANTIAGLSSVIAMNRSSYDSSLSWVGDTMDFRTIERNLFMQSGGLIRRIW